MKVIKKIFWVLFAILLIAQFFRPEKNIGNVESISAFIAETTPSKKVKTILENSCFDCHSAVTKYPWYNAITPINYWLENHISHGKKHFNVSKWDYYSTEKKLHKFEELIDEVETKKMPLKSYTYMHSHANLSSEDTKAVIDWANQVKLIYYLQPKPQ